MSRNIKWFKDSKQIKANQSIFYQIDRVNSKDFGVYSCKTDKPNRYHEILLEKSGL